ncbi:hypothetical protein FWK35_00026928 [Aphis craccivora]|uniref:Uncharacterized protein n=1 Tax=Aphis craccivora TaxID=307492 RepID=A0A6G0Y1K3_APHCR|nr:hypothetical protein FWK35_00026928 [Aphis craccivora]
MVELHLSSKKVFSQK